MITLKLDASGVNSLFPEGSEARVNLSQAVVAETVKKTLPKYLGEAVDKQIAICVKDNHELMSQVSDGTLDALSEYLSRSYSGLHLLGSTEILIQGEVRERVSKAVSRQFEQALVELVNKEVNKQTSEFLKQVDAIVAAKLTNLSGLDLDKFISARAKRLLEKAAMSDTEVTK